MKEPESPTSVKTDDGESLLVKEQETPFEQLMKIHNKSKENSRRINEIVEKYLTGIIWRLMKLVPFDEIQDRRIVEQCVVFAIADLQELRNIFVRD